MNETYQHPGKWHEYHIKPTPIRTDGSHFLMSYLVKNLEHNAVYEAIVQAKNKYGWNEVRKGLVNNIRYILKNFLTFFFRSAIFISFIREIMMFFSILIWNIKWVSQAILEYLQLSLE